MMNNIFFGSNMLGVGFMDLLWLYIILALLLIGLIIFLIVVPMKVWFRALISGAHISMSKLVGMKLRKINISLIVETYISARKAGLDLDVEELETRLAETDFGEFILLMLTATNAEKVPAQEQMYVNPDGSYTTDYFYY